MFAPLMDQMTTRHISRRFTASEALQFFEDFQLHLIQEQLDICPPERDRHSHCPYDEFDRWSPLPEDFVQMWSHYREPNIPSMTRLLRRICCDDWGLAVVHLIRRATKLMHTLLFARSTHRPLGSSPAYSERHR
jgi:hypothetical protein